MLDGKFQHRGPVSVVQVPVEKKELLSAKEPCLEVKRFSMEVVGLWEEPVEPVVKLLQPLLLAKI